MKLSLKAIARKEAFRKIGETISNRPTVFNPNFEIKPTRCNDPLIPKIGPQLKTVQWSRSHS